MDSAQNPIGHDDIVTKIYAEEMITSFREKIRDAESLAKELSDVLANYGSAPSNERPSNDPGTLAFWIREYRDSLRTAEKIARDGMHSLKNLDDHLRPQRNDGSGKAPKALERFENEGGSVLQKPDIYEEEDLTNAA